ncbi:MAG: hypothetical protein BRC43_08865 [Cyanobacteria bacterium QS_3_48_167]|nr:MAG: hypothetical protein BRC45_15425 [Cyanobacteria bacterium QS_5_48_63]PSO87542.1 MAG: hypothetical protein BRC43_08865 [Cyanobacteria bacterium QS_3_48_167]
MNLLWYGKLKYGSVLVIREDLVNPPLYQPSPRNFVDVVTLPNQGIANGLFRVALLNAESSSRMSRGKTASPRSGLGSRD